MNLKDFGKSAVMCALGNVGLRAAPFLLIPLYTHSLSVSEYGLLATLLISIQIMLIIMSLGMRTSLLRFTREYADNSRLKDLLGTTTILNLAGGLIITGISISFLLPVFRMVLHTAHVRTFIILACSAALMQSLCSHIMSFYRARNESVKFMIAGISAAAILIAANFFLLKIFNWGVIGALTAYIVTYSVVLIFMLIDVVPKTGIGISVSLTPELLAFGCPLIFSMLGQLVMGGASLYFLSYFAGLEDVAIYSLGHKLASILLISLMLPFKLAFDPYVFANIDRQGIKRNLARLLTYLILSTSAVSCVLLLTSRAFLPLIAPPAYASAYSVMLLMIPAMVFFGISYFGETLLIVIQRTKLVATVVTICAILSVILNYALVPRFGWYGAIAATNVSYGLAGLILTVLGLRAVPLPIETKRLSIAAGLLLSVLLLNLALSAVSDGKYFSINIMAICIGAGVIYFSGFFDEEEKAAIKGILN